MKKIILIIAIIIAFSIQSHAQALYFQQDIKGSVAGSGLNPIPTTLIQWDQPVKNGFSAGPFALLSGAYYEALWFINYTHKAVSFGFGTGVEQVGDNTYLRLSPWGKFAPTLKDSTKSIQLFSLWEWGKGSGYYYYNTVTYETPHISLGLIGRRTYGVGPLFGIKGKVGSFVLQMSGAVPYDVEDKVLKPTLFFTITN